MDLQQNKMEKNQLKLKSLNIVLWSLQILLAATFFWSGFVKLFTPAEELSRMWPWTEKNPILVAIAGIADLLAGIGLTLPRLLRIWPAGTLYACYGIILLMAAAIIFHVSRGEIAQLGINFVVILITIAMILLWKYLRKSSHTFLGDKAGSDGSMHPNSK